MYTDCCFSGIPAMNLELASLALIKFYFKNIKKNKSLCHK